MSAASEAMLAAGMSPEEVAGIEAGVQQRAAHDQQVRAANQSAEVLRAGFDYYYNQGEDPAAVATWVEQNGGPEAAQFFLDQWRSDSAAFDDPPEPLTPDAWEYQQAEQQAEAYDRAEMIQAGQIEAAERRRAEQAQAIAEEFTSRHPNAKKVAPLLLAELANVDPGTDPTVALEAGLRTAVAKNDVGAVSLRAAEQSQPFASTLRDRAFGVTKTLAEQFPTAESLAAERAASVQAKAESIYAREQELVGALATPEPTHAELQQEAAASFTRGRELWNDGLVKTGQSAMNQRDRAAEKARNAVVDQAEIIRLAQVDRGAAFRASADLSEQASRAPAVAPEPIPVAATEHSSRAWWMDES